MSFKETQRGKENTLRYTCLFFFLNFPIYFTISGSLNFYLWIHLQFRVVHSLQFGFIPTSLTFVLILKHATFPYVIYLTIQFYRHRFMQFRKLGAKRKKIYVSSLLYLPLLFFVFKSAVLFKIVKIGNNSNIHKEMNE